MDQMFINNRPEEKIDFKTVDEEPWLFESHSDRGCGVVGVGWVWEVAASG